VVNLVRSKGERERERVVVFLHSLTAASMLSSSKWWASWAGSKGMREGREARGKVDGTPVRILALSVCGLGSYPTSATFVVQHEPAKLVQ
jgi:hypothetical protein